MIVVTAPSGAGKSTIVRHLLRKFPALDFSVSATTREPREGEIDGRDYHFLSAADFHAKVEAGAFVEWEEVYPGQFYGTLKSEVKRLWDAGRHIVFDIDVKGARRIKKMYGNQCLTVFVKPPSYKILVERLINRRSETKASFLKRLERIKEELTYENAFDVVLVNDVLQRSLAEAELIAQNFIPTLSTSPWTK